MRLREWGMFVLLGLIWGTSFLWIKIALEEIGPFMLVAIRLLFGVVGLLVVLRVQRQPLPRDRHTLLSYLFLGAFQTAVPFILISWGETSVDSALAAILNGTMPLFTIVIAHFWLHDERITIPRLIGLVVGFVGVVVLMSRDLGPQALQSSLLGQLAVLAAAISYAMSATYARRYVSGQPPVVQSTLVILFADLMSWLALLAFERPLVIPVRPLTWLALAWLGLLGSCLAYMLYYTLLNSWGATRASLVTYVLPLIGLLLGVIFLDEQLDWQLAVGSALVLAGIGVVNVRRPQRAVLPASVGGED